MNNSDYDSTPPKRTSTGRKVIETAQAATLRRERKQKEKRAAEKKAAAEKAAVAEAVENEYDAEDLVEEEEDDIGKKDDDADSSDEEAQENEMDAILGQLPGDAAKDVAGTTKATKKLRSKTTKTTARSASKRISSALKATSTKKKISTSSMTKWLENLGFDPANHPPFLTSEGIVSFSDLAELDDKTLRDVLNQKAYNKIPALVKQRIITARMLIQIFIAIGRTLTRKSLSMAVIKDFQQQYKMISKAAEKEPGAFPPYKSGVDSLVFENAVTAYLKMAFGQFDIPLTYLIRKEKVPGSPPPLAPGKCYSAKFRSLADELIAYLPIDGSAKNEKAKAYKAKIAALEAKLGKK